MKMLPACRMMNLFILALVALLLPTHVAGGALRGLLFERPSALQPLQRPPPATADAAYLQLSETRAPAPAPVAASPYGPGPSPGPAPGPAPAPAPAPAPEFKIPAITEDTCKQLQEKVGKLIGVAGAGGPGPAPAPQAAVLLEGSKVAWHARAPSPAEEKPTVECKIYAWVSKQPAGCNCFLEAPPPPAAPAKVAGCPQIPDALSMGFTGSVVTQGPMAFGGQTGGWTRHTCVYRQWFFDPVASGPALAYQTKLNDARAEKYIMDTYKASLKNAHNTAKAYWALTPVPWLKLYPTKEPPFGFGAMGPAPGPAPGPGGFPTTPPILYFEPPTTPAMFTPPPYMPGMFGGATTTAGPAMGGFGLPTTAPTYVAVR